MFGTRSGGKSGKVIAVADIGSDGAGVAIVHILPGEPAAILVAERMTLTFEERSPEQKISGVLSLLDDVCQKVTAKYTEAYAGERTIPVSSSYAIIHSLWTNSKIMEARAAFPKEELITPGIIDNLARTAFNEEKQIDRSNLIEASVVSIELNGYKVSKIEGKRAHSVLAHALLSECEPAIRTGVIETLRRNFSVHSPILRSSTRALYAVLHEKMPQAHNRTIIEMESDMTNCIVVRKDEKIENALVEEGTGTILKRIVPPNAPSEETLSLMRMVSRDACESDACQSLNIALAKVEPELARIFGEVFARLTSIQRLPNTLVIIARPEFAPWLHGFFSRVDFGHFTVTTQPFSPNVLTLDDMSHFTELRTGEEVDPSLVLAASFVNIEELQV